MITNILQQALLLFKQRKGMGTIVSIIIVLAVAIIIFFLINNWTNLSVGLIGSGNKLSQEALLG